MDVGKLRMETIIGKYDAYGLSEDNQGDGTGDHH